MIEGKPSATAQRVAERRALHQLLDLPLVFDDPLALAIIGRDAAAALRAGAGQADDGPLATGLRAFFAVRARFAEDSLAAAIRRGVRQYVILGAGLDTFAYRNPYPAETLTVFEVDHPATQAWKRERLADVAIPIPATLRFVAADFGREAWPDRLASAGFDPRTPTLFAWLGVSMYLERRDVDATFEYVASVAGAGGGLVFDYAVDPAMLTAQQRRAFDSMAARVKAAGEPWRTFFSPDELADTLHRLGFTVEDLDPRTLHAQYGGGRGHRPETASRARLVRAIRGS